MKRYFPRYLYTAGMPDVDLLIRTGGELRISNFLLWQAAYAEYYFTKVLWPDFTPGQLGRALAAYSRRQRRFGRVSEEGVILNILRSWHFVGNIILFAGIIILAIFLIGCTSGTIQTTVTGSVDQCCPYASSFSYPDSYYPLYHLRPLPHPPRLHYSNLQHLSLRYAFSDPNSLSYTYGYIYSCCYSLQTHRSPIGPDELCTRSGQ